MKNQGMFKDQVKTDIRRGGVFWTPLEWVAETHNFLDGIYGSKWAKEVVIWDPCCGGGHLTRGLNPAYLIQTTLEHEDIETLGGKKETEFLIRRQMDFLNELILPSSIDEMLTRAANNGIPVMFLMNPPYATPGKTAVRWDSVKSGISDTLVKGYMEGVYGQDQLYLQFIWRCLMLAERYGFDFRIGVFSAITYLLKESFSSFHEVLFSHCRFKKGFVLPSNQFENIKTKWMVLFGLYEKGGTGVVPKHFEIEVKDKDRSNRIYTEQKRYFYRVSDENSAFKWVKSLSPRPRAGHKVPAMTTGVRLNGRKAKIRRDAFGFLTFNNFILQERDNFFLTSSASVSNRGISLIERNFWPAISCFCVMRLLNKSWTVEKDELFIPETHHELWHEWCYNALVYMLFNKQNNASGNTVDWSNSRWRLFNHMFWLTRNEVAEIWPDLVFDEPEYNYKVNRPYIEKSGDLYPYARLQLERARDSDCLWVESEKVITGAIIMMKALYETRKIGHPVYQYERWDAGYFQLRSMFYAAPTAPDFFKIKIQDLRRRLVSMIPSLGFFRHYVGGVIRDYDEELED